MKVKLTITLILFSLMSFGQTEHASQFEYTISEENNTQSIINDYIVYQMEGMTASQSYELILKNIKDIYNNPSEVITAQKENEFIKINGVSKNLYCQNVIGSTFCDSVHYNLEFYLKDNRIKIDLSRLEFYQNASQYASAGFYDAKTINTHKKNGKTRKQFEKTPIAISDYFNNLVLSLVKKEQGSNAKSDW